jgi:uncharacterized protein
LTDISPRLHTLDTVRGVAVLGILLLNIVSFGLPEAAYMNPRAYGGWHGADLVAWAGNFILFDGKMRGLFSFLFGASMLLVIQRAEASGQDPAKIHFARMGWLFAFGMVHLLLVWHGDILAHYATIGMIAFACRDLPVSRLLGMGVVLVLVEAVLLGSLSVGVAAMEAAGNDPHAARTLADYQRDFGVPPPDILARELAVFRGSYAGILLHRLQEDVFAPLQLFFAFGPETLGYMLFGMAGLRSGMLRGEWPRTRYVTWAAIGLGIGVPAYAAIAGWIVWRQFDLFSVMAGEFGVATVVRPVMIFGWACLIILLMRPGGWLTVRLAAAGRMAFTNYLATSLICTTIFYGYGLGWFGWLSRAELYLVVAAIWALILLWSHPWLIRFRYGPLEWLWRSLARSEIQPLRINASGTQ